MPLLSLPLRSGIRGILRAAPHINFSSGSSVEETNLQEAELGGLQALTSGPESVSRARAGLALGAPSLSCKALLSWRDIKTHTKCFQVLPALGLWPSRRINPGAAGMDMSSPLGFHVCPQFQCHHTKSRLIVTRPPSRSPCSPGHIWISQPLPGAPRPVQSREHAE